MTTFHTTARHPLNWLIGALASRKQRLHLEELDDHMLADIGLSRAEALREAHRGFFWG